MNDLPEKTVRFTSSVLEKFAFLEHVYGFVPSVDYRGYSAVVRYDGPSMYVSVGFGPPDYEPGMFFGPKAAENLPLESAFGVGDLIQLQGYEPSPTYASADRMDAHIAWLASILAETGKSCLHGDTGTFAELASRRRQRMLEWNRNQRNKAIADNIEIAWKARDYWTVVQLYAEYDGPLSSANQKRLEIARKRL